jgi:hypothetical protein
MDAAKVLENTTDETPNLLLNFAVLEKYSLKIRNKSTTKPFVAHAGLIAFRQGSFSDSGWQNAMTDRVVTVRPGGLK